jgi:hypothetical protein
MITFTRVTQTYIPSMDTMTSVETTVTGDAFAKRITGADALRYQELGLRLSETIMLLFTPTTYGELPAPGDTVVWPPAGTNATTYTVRDVSQFAPDGVTILAYVACSR